MSHTTLSQLKPGESAEIIDLAEQPKTYRQKLLSMGLTPGTQFTVVRSAPLGDPIEILVRGFALSLRKAEGALLKLQAVS